MDAPKITTDTILSFLKEAVESKRVLNEEIWLDAAFKLNLLLGDEHLALEDFRQEVAQSKLVILKGQEKRNVAAADLETQASDPYRLMKLQEHKVDRIEEFIKIAKKNVSQF